MKVFLYFEVLSSEPIFLKLINYEQIMDYYRLLDTWCRSFF